jgi:hypothetical protein
MTRGLAATILLLASARGVAHRLDEYLQGTIVSVDKNRLQGHMTLTPGIAVLPFVISQIDTNADGVISEAEQVNYAGRVLRDLSLSSDGHRITPRLVSVSFPTSEELQEGRGEIQLDFVADLPPGGHNRNLTLDNRHQARISAYQVNCLVPRDPDIRIAAQNRDYSQSHYVLEYMRADIRPDRLPVPLRTGDLRFFGACALLLVTRFKFLWRANRHSGRCSSR